MKKPVKITILMAVVVISFLLGWRAMPRVWPHIKEAVVYPLFPQLKPAPVEQELYTPHSSASFENEIHSSDSVIYYFYKDYCPYCRELEPLTAGLPDQITLPDGTTSNVKLICLNKVEDSWLKIITDYYEAHDIPEERQYVPAIVIGERYLFLGDEIIDQMMDALAAGEGLDTPLLNGSERIP